MHWPVLAAESSTNAASLSHVSPTRGKRYSQHRSKLGSISHECACPPWAPVVNVLLTVKGANDDVRAVCTVVLVLLPLGRHSSWLPPYLSLSLLHAGQVWAAGRFPPSLLHVLFPPRWHFAELNVWMIFNSGTLKGKKIHWHILLNSRKFEYNILYFIPPSRKINFLPHV